MRIADNAGWGAVWAGGFIPFQWLWLAGPKGAARRDAFEETVSSLEGDATKKYIDLLKQVIRKSGKPEVSTAGG